MLKKIKLGLVALLLPVMALAQSYPSPTFNNVTVLGTLTGAISGGTLTNPTITGGTITGATITGGTISGLTSPLPVASGGTNTASASGTALDNITGFSSTGFISRTGAGAYSFTASTGSGSVVLSTSPSIASPTVTGAFSATGLVTTADLATQAANTVIANVTGSTASPTAFVMPSCSTSASALNYTSGTGWGCNTAVNAAQLGGATFAAPGPIGSTTASTAAFTTLSASTSNPSFNYLGSGTGAVARSYASKFGDTVSAVDFGADPTGVADSTSAIQSAITYVLSLPNGGAVYMPKGTYKVSSAINMPNTAGVSIRLYGDGAATKIRYFGSASLSVFNAGSSTATFGSLYVFDDFGFLGPTGGTVTAFYLTNINNSLFYNVSVFGNTNAVILQSSYNTRFIGDYFNSQTQYGIATNVTGTNALYVYQTGISGAGTAAIALGVGGNNIVIRDSDLEANSVTLEMLNYTSVLFEGNYVENGTNSSFSFSGTNNAIDIRQNWFGANTTSTTIGNVTGGSFVNNTIYNSNWTFSNTFDMDSGGNILTGTATLASTPFQTTISYLNNWTAGGYTPGYKKSSNGIVELRGFVLAGTGSLGSPAFVLPAAYRPSQRKQFPIIDLTTSTVGTCIVDTNGNVVPNVAGGAVGNGVSLDGIMFNAGN